jgi:hypothetical protein
MRPMRDNPYDFGRPHYFTTAWFISCRKNTFDMFWHERYKLALSRSDGKHQPGNEIKELLGRPTVEKLHSINQYFPKAFKHLKPNPNALVEFKDPDVVAFRDPRCFGFYEIKGEREKFQFLQLESLAILKTLIPDAEVAVVRMIEKGGSYSPTVHPYSFSLDLEL